MTDRDDRVRELFDAKGFTLKPWEVHLAEVDDGPSPWPPGTAGHSGWPKAQALRRKLLKLAAAGGELDGC